MLSRTWYGCISKHVAFTSSPEILRLLGLLRLGQALYLSKVLSSFLENCEAYANLKPDLTVLYFGAGYPALQVRPGVATLQTLADHKPSCLLNKM